MYRIFNQASLSFAWIRYQPTRVRIPIGYDEIGQKIKNYMAHMRAVRFELTHLSIAELKSAALDHSAKLADSE